MSQADNLTIMEVAALTDTDGGLNLTDGHARLTMTKEQEAIIECVPDMFAQASRRPFPDIETEAHATFLSAIGQHQAPVGTGRILSCYSSTLATDIVARALPAGATIALLHPTFDNIADLFRTRGLHLTPLSEEQLLAKEWPAPPVHAIVVTHPNNPTGVVMPEPHLRSLAEHAAEHGQTVIVDASFRGQVPEAQYDCYAVLNEAGSQWIVIEDTGKLWPTHELKLGMLAHSEGTPYPIERAFSESLLSASPVVMLLVAALARDWTSGGFERARDLVSRNRRVVQDAISQVELELADPQSQISVARVELPPDGPDSSELYADLVRRGVHVLPCVPFHWADPAEGQRFIRLSLARPHAVVQEAATALARSFETLAAPRAASLPA